MARCLSRMAERMVVSLMQWVVRELAEREGLVSLSFFFLIVKSILINPTTAIKLNF